MCFQLFSVCNVSLIIKIGTKFLKVNKEVFHLKELVYKRKGGC